MIAKSIRCLLPKQECPGQGRRGWPRDEKGTLVLALLAIFSVAAALGTTLVTTNRTATGVGVRAHNFAKAKYLAEAGGRYALPRIQEILAVGGNPTTLGYTNQRFTLAGPGDGFLLDLSPDDPYNPSKYILTSTGTLANDSATKTIHYQLPIPATILGFQTVGNFVHSDRRLNYAGDTLNPDDWNVSGEAEVNAEPAANHTRQQVLTLTTSRHHHHHRHGTKEALASTAWANDLSSLPYLSDIWAANDNLLSYALQVKISLDKHPSMAGISFRLTTPNQRSSVYSTFYGVSYLFNTVKQHKLPTFSPPPNLADRSSYLILWQQQADGTKTILHQKKLLPVDGVVKTGHGESLTIKPMTALIVNVVEKYRQDAAGNYLNTYGRPTTDPASYKRYNQISVYIQNSASYLPGEVSWDYSRFQPVTWDDRAARDRCESGESWNCVADSRYTSDNFTTRKPDEIGLHSYGSGNNDLADFAVFFPPAHQVVQDD